MTSSPSALSPTAVSAAAPSPSQIPAWIQNRWVQGTAAGVLTLVPVRRYPEWLRQAIMWVPAASITTILVTPRVWEAMAEAGRTSAEHGPDQLHEPGERDPVEQQESPPLVEDDSAQDQKPPLSPRRRVALWGIGVAAGASVYGYMRFSLWLDGAIEDKLREHGIARPRIAMAVLGGLVTTATGSAGGQQRSRVDSPEAGPRLAASGG